MGVRIFWISAFFNSFFRQLGIGGEEGKGKKEKKGGFFYLPGTRFFS